MEIVIKLVHPDRIAKDYFDLKREIEEHLNNLAARKELREAPPLVSIRYG
jgi:hypothetical protein